MHFFQVQFQLAIISKSTCDADVNYRVPDRDDEAVRQSTRSFVGEQTRRRSTKLTGQHHHTARSDETDDRIHVSVAGIPINITDKHGIGLSMIHRPAGAVP